MCSFVQWFMESHWNMDGKQAEHCEITFRQNNWICEPGQLVQRETLAIHEQPLCIAVLNRTRAKANWEWWNSVFHLSCESVSSSDNSVASTLVTPAATVAENGASFSFFFEFQLLLIIFLPVWYIKHNMTNIKLSGYWIHGKSRPIVCCSVCGWFRVEMWTFHVDHFVTLPSAPCLAPLTSCDRPHPSHTSPWRDITQPIDALSMWAWTVACPCNVWHQSAACCAVMISVWAGKRLRRFTLTGVTALYFPFEVWIYAGGGWQPDHFWFIDRRVFLIRSCLRSDRWPLNKVWALWVHSGKTWSESKPLSVSLLLLLIGDLLA